MINDLMPIGRAVALFIALGFSSACARVDTLRDTSDIEDAVIYSWENCNSEFAGEDCRRYNSGGLTTMTIGCAAIGEERRAVLRMPGWNGDMPDSAKLLLYCMWEKDTHDRRLLAFPLTRSCFEGNELACAVGDYPEPDSGVTWLHAWLDVGDLDSLAWTVPGGDYSTEVVCTAMVTGTGQYCAFENFERILSYWRTNGTDYGLLLINENAFPGNTSAKGFGSTEGLITGRPQVILFFTDASKSPARRRLVLEKLLGGH